MARTWATRVKSTSNKLFTCAETRRDMIMWSAVSFRILLHGSTRSPGHGSTTGDGTSMSVVAPRAPGARGATGAPAPACAGVTVGAASRKVSTSFLVTRPAIPLPAMALMSRLCSAAILRTSGVLFRRKRSSAVSTPVGAGCGAEGLLG